MNKILSSVFHSILNNLVQIITWAVLGNLLVFGLYFVVPKEHKKSQGVSMMNSIVNNDGIIVAIDKNNKIVDVIGNTKLAFGVDGNSLLGSDFDCIARDNRSKVIMTICDLEDPTKNIRDWYVNCIPDKDLTWCILYPSSSCETPHNKE